MNLKSAPWERLMHVFGRASDVPQAIHDLESGIPEVRESALDLLRRTLEHQDSVVQASPLSIAFLVDALERLDAPLREQLLDLLRKILQSADFQLECYGTPREGATLAWLVSEEQLLPPFSSTAADDAWLEDNPFTEEDLRVWAYVSIGQLIENQEVLAQVASAGSPKAANLLREIDLLSARLSSAPN